MARRTEQLSEELHDYLIAHSTPPDAVLRDLAQETARRFGDVAGMQIGPEQGTFMTLLARMAGARQAIEVGTFTGYPTKVLLHTWGYEHTDAAPIRGAHPLRNIS